jgi:hypothetical protein
VHDLKTTLILIGAMLGNPQSKPAPHLPKNAPPLYVSQQFGLAVKVPAGLTICPLSAKWSGTEDGTVLFLSPPSACVDAPISPSSTRPTLGFTPYIQLRYRANIGRYDNYDGDIPSPSTSAEMAQQFCPGHVASPEIKLFGQPALTCRSSLTGDKVRIVLMAVYGPGHNALLLTLMTTQERVAADEKVLASVSAGITECAAASESKKEIPVCPQGSTW